MNDLRDLSCLCSNDFDLCQMNLNDSHEQFCADHELPRFLLGEYIDWTQKCHIQPIREKTNGNLIIPLLTLLFLKEHKRC